MLIVGSTPCCEDGYTEQCSKHEYEFTHGNLEMNE
jgi:hypothetical protein